MLSSLIAGTATIALSFTTAQAFPGNPYLGSPGADLERVHHKPGHQGGPPWLRRSQPGLGQYYGWERRGWDRRDRLMERRSFRRDDWDDRRRPSSRFDYWYD